MGKEPTLRQNCWSDSTRFLPLLFLDESDLDRWQIVKAFLGGLEGKLCSCEHTSCHREANALLQVTSCSFICSAESLTCRLRECAGSAVSGCFFKTTRSSEECAKRALTSRRNSARYCTQLALEASSSSSSALRLVPHNSELLPKNKSS